MIKAITDVNELTKIFVNELIIQSELDKRDVHNGESKHGNDLGRISNDGTKLIPYKKDDLFLVFEIGEMSNSNIMTEEQEDGTIDQFFSNTCHIVVYGTNSVNLAQKLKARFHSENVILKLLNKGVHITDITVIKEANEYINSVYWTRRDLTIEFSCRLNVEQIDKSTEYEEMNSLDVVVKS